MAFYVQQLWRYPVKSLRGESVERVEAARDGLAGDRTVVVRDARGAIVTARSRPRLLHLRATVDGDGQTLVDGVPWSSGDARAIVHAAAGEGAELCAAQPHDGFDLSPLLVATDGAIAAFGRDGRRLRPNIVIGGVDGLAEFDWVGARLRIGDVLVALHARCERCVLTTFHPDTLVQDAGVLRDIRARFDGRLALNAAVLQPGAIALGDPVELLTDGD